MGNHLDAPADKSAHWRLPIFAPPPDRLSPKIKSVQVVYLANKQALFGLRKTD
jgi:hypothetical protein